MKLIRVRKQDALTSSEKEIKDNYAALSAVLRKWYEDVSSLETVEGAKAILSEIVSVQEKLPRVNKQILNAKKLVEKFIAESK